MRSKERKIGRGENISNFEVKCACASESQMRYTFCLVLHHLRLADKIETTKKKKKYQVEITEQSENRIQLNVIIGV